MKKPSPTMSKGKNILRCLLKAASCSMSSPAYNSPGRDRAHCHRNFSGPILPVIPAEARRKTAAGGFEPTEPTSPKVTCVGQVKRRKIACGSRSSSASGKEGKFRRTAGRGGGGGDPAREEETHAARAPLLGQLRTFANGREGLGGFHWKAHRVGDEPAEERVDEVAEGEDGEEEEELNKVPSVQKNLSPGKSLVKVTV